MQYGPESSLLASEDRLLGGVFQHRAGKFPWGTSRKDREEARKSSSLGSVEVPLPAGSREREHADSPTSMPPVVEELPSGQATLPSGQNALASGHSLPSGHNVLPSGHNAVDVGRLLIDLLDVKEEDV